jgi:tetratricopeptide (TPR) repeat protein
MRGLTMKTLSSLRLPVTLGAVLQVALPLVFLALLAPCVGRAQEGKRFALVVGNNTYPMAPLRNAVNDARIMDKALRNAGFRTILVENATYSALEEGTAQFLQQLGPDDTALFFYAGHGVQIENENFLVPVDFAAASSVIQAKHRCFSMAQFLDELKNRPKRSIVILDACRSNPVAQSQALEAGLAQPQNAGKETYIAFSTGPGQVAADNPNGRDSWFSEALADLMGQQALTLEDVFTRVRSRVSSETGGKQTPWSTSNLTSRFYFFPPANADSEVDPAMAEKWMGEARLREQREDWAEAIRLVEQVLQKKPGGTLQAMAASKLPYLKARSQAQASYEASDFAAAAGLDGQALKLDPFALDAAFQGVNGYLLADRLPDAVRLLQQIRVRGTTASLERADGMLKALAPVEPEAGKALQAGVPQPPPVEEVLSGTLFRVPDFDAGARYLLSTPVDLTRWSKEVTAALTPPAPPPPPPDAAQPIAALSEAELKVAQAFLHVEIVPSEDARDIAIRRIGGADGAAASAAAASGFVQLDGPQAQTPVLMNGMALARQVPARVPLPVGKYEIRIVDGGKIINRETVEVTPASVSMMTIRSQLSNCGTRSRDLC